MTRSARVFAPAKINLALHVTGQREDGYHLLDSLVAFAGIGDLLTVDLSGPSGLEVTGPRAEGVPTDARNLILQTLTAIWPGVEARITLDKHLPAMAGIGGGSADAAALYRAMAALTDAPPKPSQADLAKLLGIGADIPACIASAPTRMRGIGEDLTPLQDIPPLPILLVNPGVTIPTPAVFAALETKQNPPLDSLPTGELLLDWLKTQCNDLEAPAILRQPIIEQTLTEIFETQGCQLARMSGSGATCFGLYASEGEAQAAANTLSETHPDWWIAPTRLDGQAKAAPQLIRATT
ncbi:4-(cytidine 5'-diphospho)-2-C-methyl-D-erythritol kinase [Aestuariibius insulae]|uniref:4-(cytidine 5'-diphospho)-2-C-methyl-D-erythritol kinase n=1 Tax=Aestuariibius insulae TaxID=2058287 RepID=UPI00345EE33B